jgi:hypothetical protein
VTTGRLAIHGHFYQPDRRDPFTGRVPSDPSAGPHHDWMTRITGECYAPNAERGNFARIGWDIGPALASWLRRERPDVHERIAAQERGTNGLALGYHHTILPLASLRDRRTEIRWGLRDFELRFGHRPLGLWLPETAVDLATLRIAAEEGVRYTILAPWQAGEPVDTRVPYRVALGGNRSIVVVFYDQALSSAVSFDPAATVNADQFAQERVRPRFSSPRGRPRRDVFAALAVIATDGELYGHHQPFRELFLSRLAGWRYVGFRVTTVGDALPAADPDSFALTTIHERTSWSCHHGVARWSAECPDAADGRWKQPLRAALDRLATAIDVVSEREAGGIGVELWSARERWADVASEYADPGAVVDDLLREAVNGAPARATRAAVGGAASETLERLLTAQASRLAMFASDAWFWEDPSRPETLQSLRFAAHAAETVDAVVGSELERSFVNDLGVLRSPLTGANGSELYELALETIGRERQAGGPSNSRQPNAGR